MAIIKRIGTACTSRTQARELAKQNGGKVIDMSQHHAGFIDSQIVCASLAIPNTTPRWIVIADKVHSLQSVKNTNRLAKRVVDVVQLVSDKNGKHVTVLPKKFARAMAAYQIAMQACAA